MTLLVLAWLGGVLTILSPCILPVLPFVFARAGQSFARSALPMLAGMAVTFALVAMLVTVGGVALEPSTGTPSSPSAIPPAASASGPRITGCDCPTNGSGIGTGRRAATDGGGIVTGGLCTTTCGIA